MPVLNFAKALRLGGQHVDAVHLDHHRVFPPPRPFLVPPVGQVTTPDTAADAVTGDLRVRFRIRVDALGDTRACIAMQRASGASNIAFDLGIGQGDGRVQWRWATAPGTAFAASPSILQPGGITPGVDQWIGGRMETTSPSVLAFTGESSTDGGTTWQPNGSTGTYTPFQPFDSTASVVIGGLPSGQVRFPGRIYWVELTRINRTWLVLPGVNGNYLSTPHAANLNAPGDIEIVARIAPTTWRPASNVAILSKYATAGNQRAWGLQLQSSGALGLLLSSAGTTTNATATSSVVIPADTQALWVKVTRELATGFTIFATAPDQGLEPTTWTPLGSTITMSAGTSFFPGSTSPVEVGSMALGTTQMYAGRILRAILRTTIGGAAVFDVRDNDASRRTGNTFPATTAQTITITQPGAAAIVQPQPESIVWRFDANEWPVAATSLTDPRGRAWAATNGATISHPASVPDP